MILLFPISSKHAREKTGISRIILQITYHDVGPSGTFLAAGEMIQSVLSGFITMNDQATYDADSALPNGARTLKEAVWMYERELIMEQLQRNNFDKRRVAKLLGISISSLYRKIAEFSPGDSGVQITSIDEPADLRKRVS